MSIRSIFGAAVLASASMLALPVQAADDGFCKDYARAALGQLRTAQKHRRCDGFVAEAPDRWNSSFKSHYEWCRTVSKDKAWAERNHRRHAIEKCTRRD